MIGSRSVLATGFYAVAHGASRGAQWQHLHVPASIKINVQQAQRGISSAKSSPSQYEDSWHSRKNDSPDLSRHHAYIALGSNVGNRISMIESACREMDRHGIHVLRTSALYETKAMYLQNQTDFINGTCEVETTLTPLVLLDKLKGIENALGREKSIENGPRSIDLDILLYDNEFIDHERLSIPHKRLSEREFVLEPLCELIPNTPLPPPYESATPKSLLSMLPKSDPPLSPLTPYSPKFESISSISSTRPTHIMSILNFTPDSFSDGGQHTNEPSSLISTLNGLLSSGVSIIDIGGQSTRPNAPHVTVDEEISRVLPVIKFMRAQPAFDEISISIDTYRASVAEAAVLAGANIVNDVSAGTMDENMLSTVAKLGCTIILMHMRGNPQTMTTLTDYPSGIIEGVSHELLERVNAAEEAGIRRWRIMLDPGIGFAKTQTQNLELLRRLDDLRRRDGLGGLPWVVGASRKGFIGKITGVEKPNERAWGTAATVCAAVQGGADVVRVHDVMEMTTVAKMADAIWRI